MAHLATLPVPEGNRCTSDDVPRTVAVGRDVAVMVARKMAGPSVSHHSVEAQRAIIGTLRSPHRCVEHEAACSRTGTDDMPAVWRLAYGRRSERGLAVDGAGHLSLSSVSYTRHLCYRRGRYTRSGDDGKR